MCVFVPEGSDMLHETQPEEDDGDGEQAQTECVKMDGGTKHIGHVDAERHHQQRVHQPIKHVPDNMHKSRPQKVPTMQKCPHYDGLKVVLTKIAIQATHTQTLQTLKLLKHNKSLSDK